MRILIAALWAAFAALVIAVGVILLPACGLFASLVDVVPVVGWNFCKPSEAWAARTRNDALTQQAEELQIEIAKRTLACLQPSPPGDKPPTPQETGKVEPERPISPKAEEQRATKPPEQPATAVPGDFAFLKGCWQSEPFQHFEGDVKGQSTYCFDDNGAGQLEFRRFDTSSSSCRMAAQASTQGDQLRLRDSDSQCSDGTPWYADNLDCSRPAGDAMECHGTSKTSTGDVSFAARLRRLK